MLDCLLDNVKVVCYLFMYFRFIFICILNSGHFLFLNLNSVILYALTLDMQIVTCLPSDQL